MFTKKLFTSSDKIWSSVLASVKVSSTAVLGWNLIIDNTNIALPHQWRGKAINVI